MSGDVTRDKVMIACVTSEVTQIVVPAIDSKIDRIHLIHYVKRGGEKGDRERFYESFYNEVERRLRAKKITVVEHSDAETYVFRSMMSQVYEILVEEEVEKKSLVYVNMSAGTPEYAAAAAICSMMFKDVEIFTVSKGYATSVLDYDQLRRNATDKNGKLVGSCTTIGRTYIMDKFPIDHPNENLLKAFKIYSVISDNVKKNSNTTVIRNLILQNVWLAKGDIEEGVAIKGTSVELEDPKNGYSCQQSRAAEYASRQRGEAVQYYRVYIKEWASRGWIKNIPGTRKYKIEDEGRMVLEVFCPERIISFGPDDIVQQDVKYLDDTTF